MDNIGIDEEERERWGERVIFYNYFSFLKIIINQSTK